MSKTKEQMIYERRATATKLLNHPHVKLCDCCRDDLVIVQEDPISSVGAMLLAGVIRRVHMAEERKS